MLKRTQHIADVSGRLRMHLKADVADSLARSGVARKTEVCLRHIVVRRAFRTITFGRFCADFLDVGMMVVWLGTADVGEAPMREVAGGEHWSNSVPYGDLIAAPAPVKAGMAAARCATSRDRPAPDSSR